jgi:hypothetical protein
MGFPKLDSWKTNTGKVDKQKLKSGMQNESEKFKGFTAFTISSNFKIYNVYHEKDEGKKKKKIMIF